MKAKDILNRLPPASSQPAVDGRPRRAATVPIPIVGEIEAMHRGAVAELKDLKAHGLIIRTLAPSEIDSGPFRDRDPRFLQDDAFTDLVESIRRDGQLQPILVRRRSGMPAWELIIGLRRLKACERLGVPVLAKDVEADDRTALLAMIAENELREDISPIERSRQLKAVLDAGVLNQSEIAAALGRHKSSISRLLALAEIPIDILEAVGDARVIPLRLGYSLAQLCRQPKTLAAMRAEATRLVTAAEAGPSIDRLDALLAAAQRAARDETGADDRGTAPVRSGRPRTAALHLRDRRDGQRLVSYNTGSGRTGPVLRLSPELGADFTRALLDWLAARLAESGRDVEIEEPRPDNGNGGGSAS